MPRVTPTLFASQADYESTARAIAEASEITDLEQRAQRWLFDRMGTRVAIGQSYQPDKWEAFAKEEAKRIVGLAPGKIMASYDTPELSAAQFAIRRTQQFVAPVPKDILGAVALTESGYVAGMSLQAKVLSYDYDHTVDNGASDTIHRAVVVDCMEDEAVRKGVGKQWLRQTAMVLDAVISDSPTTYNDMEFSQLMPEALDMTQERLDYPSPGDTTVFDIASTKAARFTDVLSGRLIMPRDDLFYSPRQLQQELLLRRLYGTFPEIPMDYFQQLTLYRREHDDAIPKWSGQMV